MPRKRTFTMDGLEIPYSPLTCDQTEVVTKRKQPAADAPQDEKNEFYKNFNLDVIRMGLNNALDIDEENSPKDQWPWTNKRILKEMDPVVYNAIEDDILVMSGLRKREPLAGESPAAN
jgi:hypothetical protein